MLHKHIVLHKGVWVTENLYPLPGCEFALFVLSGYPLVTSPNQSRLSFRGYVAGHFFVELHGGGSTQPKTATESPFMTSDVLLYDLYKCLSPRARAVCFNLDKPLGATDYLAQPFLTIHKYVIRRPML